MKTRLLVVQGKKCAWAEEAAAEFAEKIGAIIKFEKVSVKSVTADRDSADAKRAAEGKLLLKNFGDAEDVVLFDEAGKLFDGSVDFSKAVVQRLSGQRSICFVIGGPYGFSDEVRKRAVATWSLSRLTMNHHVAQVAALEQLYRALAIWKNLPYHN